MNKDEIAQLVKSGIDELNAELAGGHSHRLKEMLALMARFHRYSFNNCLLIAQQRPDATKVMGFHGWRKVKRMVKKGEKGIGITAPLAYRNKDEESDDKHIRGFRVVHVFDVSQTEGDDLPRLSEPTGDAADWIAPVQDLIRSKGIALEYGIIGHGARGVSKIKRIEILSGLQPATHLGVLVHELAHELLHPDRETRMELHHAVKETEAQAVAQVVCRALGIESIEHTADYIHLHCGDCELLSKSMQRIQECAASILGDLDKTTHIGIVSPANPTKNASEKEAVPTLTA